MREIDKDVTFLTMRQYAEASGMKYYNLQYRVRAGIFDKCRVMKIANSRFKWCKEDLDQALANGRISDEIMSFAELKKQCPELAGKDE